MRRIVMVLTVAIILLATACTQYVFVPVGTPGENGSTSGIEKAAEKILSLTTALDKQLPEDISKVMQGETVLGLYKSSGFSMQSSSIDKISVLSEGTPDTKTQGFYFDEYIVDGYGIISQGNFTVSMTGISTTDDSNTEVFTSESVSMSFQNIVLENSSDTPEPITLNNLETKAEVTISTSQNGEVTVNGMEKVTVTQSITAQTTISVGKETVDPSDIAESNTSNEHSSGLGSEAYPYIISSATEFETLGSETPAYYRLANDITLPSDIYITDFYGVLDGNGNTITYSGNEYNTSLFWALRDGAVIRNLTIDLGEGTPGKQIATTTEGDVLIENITVEGTIIVQDNNGGSGYICYVGYGDDISYANRASANVVIKNSTNRLNIYPKDYTQWGIAPFVSGFGMPTVEDNSSLTLDNCVNEGVIVGGKVGWVFGNQSGVEKLKSITITNCRNANGGSVTGYIDAGNISWNGKDSSQNITKDTSFTNMVIDKSVDSKASLNTETLEVTIAPVPDKVITMAEIIGSYQVTGYSNDALTVTPAHMTQNYVLATIDDLNGTNSTVKLRAYNAVDSRATGVTSGAESGEIIEIDGESCIFIGEDLLDGLESVIHSCVDTTTHKHIPSNVWVAGYNGDEIVYVIPVTV